MMMMLLSPMAARKRSSGEKVSHFTEMLSPLRTARGALFGKSQRMTGASGFF
jgi:hypothetical protein